MSTLIQDLRFGARMLARTVKACDARRGATTPENICNRSQQRGVHLELSAALRTERKTNADAKGQFVAAVRDALDPYAGNF